MNERDAARERLGECIGCNYNDGPDECCPQHGRTVTEWIDIASTVIGRQHAIESERDAAVAENARLLARIAAVEAELAALGTPTTEYRRQFKSSSAWHVSVNGPFAEPSNRLRDRVVDEYRIVGEWRAASPTPTGPETA